MPSTAPGSNTRSGARFVIDDAATLGKVLSGGIGTGWIDVSKGLDVDAVAAPAASAAGLRRRSG
jgi:hypothetical protein